MSGNALPTETSEPAVTDAAAHDVSVLLARADAGDQAAWNAIVDRYANLIWSVARAHRLNPADAADVVQTTWLRLVEHLHQIREPERLTSWLVTTARRECLRVLSMARREEVGADDLAVNLPDERDDAPDTRILLDERDQMLWRCFAQLPERCQLILRILMASAPPTYAEVAAALDVPVGSIGPTRGRCLERLRELVGPAGLAASDTQIGMGGT
jgi:RNA polymerase sigma factor (sigma-70 family)